MGDVAYHKLSVVIFTRCWAPQRVACVFQGTIEYARQQVEHYRHQLEHRILVRFDRAEAKKDLADMKVCAVVMGEMELSQSSSSLVQVLHTWKLPSSRSASRG